MSSPIRIHPEIEDALKRGRAVVALESAVITSGLPRDPLPQRSKLQHNPSAQDRLGKLQFDRSGPVNLELARAMQRTVREHGAVPATIAVIRGELRIGLNDDELVALASDPHAAKASVTDLATVIARGSTAGTTVSATLAACALAHSTIANPKSRIACFATGGIGGVHRSWQQLPDISADLRQLATTPVCVVCAGAKSILDLPATLEMLEALGVPVVGYRTSQFPQFLCAGDDRLRLSRRVDDASSAAEICRLHWNALQQSTGILLCNPPPDEFALPPGEVESAIEQAERTATSRRISGSQRTPFLLAELARLTASRSLDVNLALLLSNAQLAAELATSIGTR